MDMNYIGRFAPSPTGRLHIGSLLTALASYADARAAGGRWLLRMEDLDPPREMPGAADDILRTLEAFGFEWDGAVEYQSRRHDVYAEALGRLKTAGLVYPCYCSRREWQGAARQGADGFVYNGRCRNPASRPSENTRRPDGNVRPAYLPINRRIRITNVNQMRHIWAKPANLAIIPPCFQTASNLSNTQYRPSETRNRKNDDT